MKAYLTSIGERTTELARWQLDRLGFEVVLLLKNETWQDKYRRFLEFALMEGENCLRVDADVVVNRMLLEGLKDANRWPDIWLTQFTTYDLYRNEIGITCPVYYKKEALDLIDLAKLHPTRPEAEVWRQDKIKEHTYTSPYCVGIHGFYQDDEAYRRAVANKIIRKQTALYDFAVVEKIKELEL